MIGHHRATFHNVWMLLPFALALAWSLRPARRDRDLAEWMGVCLVYLASHLTMDVFAGGATLLYPLSTFSLCWFAAIEVVTATNTPRYWFEPCSYDGIPVVAEVYPWLPPNEAAFLAFLLPASVAALVWRLVLHHRRRGRRGADAADAAGEPPT